MKSCLFPFWFIPYISQGATKFPKGWWASKVSVSSKQNKTKANTEQSLCFWNSSHNQAGKSTTQKTTAGGEGGARRLGKARAYVLGRFLKSPFVYIPIIPGDKMLSAIKGMLPWLLHANKLLIRILWAQKEWKHLFKLILFSSCWQIFQLEDPIKYELLTGIKSLNMTPRNKQMGKQ